MEAAHADKREKIKAKLKALLAMTTENGCSEAEAMVAAQKAGELMEEYDLAYDDLDQVRAEAYGMRRRPFGRQANSRKMNHHEASMVLSAIARYFDSKVWTSGADIVFFGTAHDTEAAHYMAALIRVAMDQEWYAYLNGPDRDPSVHGRSLRVSFMVGMGKRLRERLDQMKAERESRTQAAGQSRALVVVTKRQVMLEKFATHCRQTGMRLGRSGGGRRYSQDGAFAAGQAAAGRVSLHQGVATGTGVRAIGHRS